MSEKIGRNDPCHCGSGKKYKKCHLEKDEVTDRKQREKAALNAAKVMAANAEAAEKAAKEGGHEPAKKGPAENQEGWMKRAAAKVGFFRNPAQRRGTPQNKGG